MRICKFKGCGLPHRAQNLCSGHYQQRKTGKTLHPLKKRRQRCSVDGCNRKHSSSGFCVLHYQRSRRTKDGKPDLTPKKMQPIICKVDGCGMPSEKLGYCGLHYQRHRKAYLKGDKPDLFAPKRIFGDGSIDHNGYKIVTVNGKKVREHRLIMEDHIGRKLFPEETVHHKNGIRHDNGLSNLELWSSNHPPGQRIKDKIEWAIGFLNDYGDIRYRQTVDL